MVQLYIDTSSDYLSVVLVADGSILSSLRIFSGRKISEELLHQVDNILVSSDIDINNINEFYAITGPGSFTGVRIGVAMAMGLAEGVSKPCYGISALDAVALTSGLSVCKVASRLKGDIFAIREYDFKQNTFSDFYCDEIFNENLNNFLTVNNGAELTVPLDKVAVDERVTIFRGECVPLYLRKSEAEINLDKAGCIKGS